jgi:hypothetical protein
MTPQSRRAGVSEVVAEIVRVSFVSGPRCKIRAIDMKEAFDRREQERLSTIGLAGG